MARISTGAPGAAYRLERADNFPEVVEGFEIAEGLTQAALTSFMTIFNVGHEDRGNVAKNTSTRVDALRADWLAQTFPDPTDRDNFDALVERLKSVRNGLVAHADGSTYDMEHGEAVTTYRTSNNAVSPEDARLFYVYALKLFDSVRGLRASGRPLTRDAWVKTSAQRADPRARSCWPR